MHLVRALFSLRRLLLVHDLVCRVIVGGSKLGRAAVAIRDGEMRTRFMGYRVEYFKLAIPFSAISWLALLVRCMCQVGIYQSGRVFLR